MDEEKIHFTHKRVDESWKATVGHDDPKPQAGREERQSRTSTLFSSLISSLGFQGLMNLGLIKTSEKETAKVDLNQAQQMIEMLLMLREKTAGNTTPEETKLLNELIAELQVKFTQYKNN